ncbi:ScbR family autoregulator-binding transcription factor [Streptomyces vilmorinianum]|uniref:ScbR family autoregulator-binding transcription factor n=1 Tax=Streptomyces vilmorinianum TaxID=3051092 RepID=UPI0010FB2261|nr:ScbR family autoregulator-binding transcription factor [Streptomyces vilmorinianum]
MTKQERATRTRQALIRSAAEEFDRHGYAQAKLAMISSGAGVSQGALHFHFVNKAAVAESVEAAASRTLRRAARMAHRNDAGPLQTLTDISHAVAHLLRRDIVVRAGFQLSCDRSRPTDLNLRQEWQGCVRQLLAAADDEDVLAEGVDQQAMTRTIVAATIGFEALSRNNREWLSRCTLTGFWQVLLPWLAVPEVLGRLDPAGRESVIEELRLLPGQTRVSPLTDTRSNALA